MALDAGPVLLLPEPVPRALAVDARAPVGELLAVALGAEPPGLLERDEPVVGQMQRLLLLYRSRDIPVGACSRRIRVDDVTISIIGFQVFEPASK